MTDVTALPVRTDAAELAWLRSVVAEAVEVVQEMDRREGCGYAHLPLAYLRGLRATVRGGTSGGAA